MVAFPRTNGQAMVLHGLHFLCPHGEPRNPQGPHVRCELPTSGLRDLSVDGPHPQPAVSRTRPGRRVAERSDLALHTPPPPWEGPPRKARALSPPPEPPAWAPKPVPTWSMGALASTRRWSA